MRKKFRLHVLLLNQGLQPRPIHPVQPHWVTVTNRAGMQIATAAVTIIETNPPVVTVVTLVPGQSVAASFLAVTGKATDESGVAQVLWNLNHELKPASCLPAKTIAPALARLRNHLF